MAYTYGTVTNCKAAGGSTRKEYECRLGYQVNSQSVSGTTGTSNITLRLQVRSISSSYYTYGYNQTTTIDGTALAAKSFDMRDTNTWQTFGERTITVTHNSSGTYSATKSGSFTTTATGTYSLKSGSASVTVNPPALTLATAPSNVTSLTASTYSIKPDGSFTVYWSGASANGSTIDYYSVDTMKYTASTGAWGSWSNSGNVNATSKTLTGRGLYSDLVPGDVIRVRVGVHNGIGWSSDSGRLTIDIGVYKDGNMRVKDMNGTARDIPRIKVKDMNGTVHDIRWVKLKDMNGNIHTIDLYWK